jgi:hypothetical protein
VHRLAIAHARRLCGRRFRCHSPNGRFTEGAQLIHEREMSRVEAIGKNLFVFFAAAGAPDVVVHGEQALHAPLTVTPAHTPHLHPTRLGLCVDSALWHERAVECDGSIASERAD